MRKAAAAMGGGERRVTVERREALDALERTLNNDRLWWRERHGHTESFRIGVEHGLSQAVAHVIQLKFQLGDGDGQR